MVVVACSDTESVSMSVVIKRGFAALRYLKDGKLIMPEETITIPAVIALPNNTRLARNCALLKIFLIIIGGMDGGQINLETYGKP